MEQIRLRTTGLGFGFRFSVRSCDKGHALIHKFCCNLSVDVTLNVRFTTNGMCAKNNTHILVYALQTSNNRVTSTGDPDGKINIAMLIFGNAEKLCPFCLMKQNKIHGFTWADQDWIGPMILKHFADQDLIGFNFCGSGLHSD